MKVRGSKKWLKEDESRGRRVSEDESRSPSPPPGGTSAQQSDNAKEKHHGRSKQAQPMVKTIEIVHKKRGKPGERKGKAGREQAKKQKK